MSAPSGGDDATREILAALDAHEAMVFRTGMYSGKGHWALRVESRAHLETTIGRELARGTAIEAALTVYKAARDDFDQTDYSKDDAGWVASYQRKAEAEDALYALAAGAGATTEES